MRAVFVADGPFANGAKTLMRKRASIWSRVISALLPKAPTADPQIIPGFPNVELNNLVLKILGLEKLAPPNNGTVGFWDQYF